MITEENGTLFLSLSEISFSGCSLWAIEMMEKRRRTRHFYCLGSRCMMVWMAGTLDVVSIKKGARERGGKGKNEEATAANRTFSFCV